MKLRIAVLAIAAGLGTASCGETSTPPGQSANPAMTREESGGTADHPAAASVAQGNSTPAAPRIQEVAPPKDARFTLFCDVIRGQDHVIVADRLKAQLMQTSGTRAWHIIHGEDQSTLFFGYYRTFDDKDHDPAEFARAQADHRRISEMKNAQGDVMFRNTMFLPLNDPDPEAPPQWNLANAPAIAYWSLQIGAYRGSPERKQYAVNAVRELRGNGVEAYYFHGETISSVCIGAWPADAIKRQQRQSGGTYSDKESFLVTNVPLPGNPEGEFHDRDGNKLDVQAPRLEILDPTMTKAIKDYPYHAINGQVFARSTKDGKEIPDASFLVLVPHLEGSAVVSPGGDGNSTAIKGADEAIRDILDNPSPGRGRLRSLDQK